jgi:hypothetical protein
VRFHGCFAQFLLNTMTIRQQFDESSVTAKV